MPPKNNRSWYLVGSVVIGLLGFLSLGLDLVPQFPSMCIILGIVLTMLIDSMDPTPPLHSHEWHLLYADVRAGRMPLGKSLLFLHAKLVFPTLFTIYLLLLILQKVKVVPSEWQAYATATIETLELLWVTVGSAVLANFTGLPDESYETKHHSPLANALTLLLICLLAYGGMWAIFVEIAVIGRVAYFVALSVGVLIALVSFMILTEPDDEEATQADMPLAPPTQKTLT